MFKCQNYRKKGHFKKDYKAPKKLDGRGQDSNQSANLSIKDVQGDPQMLSLNRIELWIVIESALFHASPNKEAFQKYT